MHGLKFIASVFFLSISLWSHSQNNPLIKTPGDGPDAIGKKEKNVVPRVKTWQISKYGSSTDTVRIDTLLDYFHNYHPAYQKSISNTNTGNYGGALLTNDFFKRSYNTGFYLLRTHDPYLLTPQQIKYYNTTTPYTLLDFSQSENKSRSNETRLDVVHSQNINPRLNVTFRYDQAKSEGQYNFQAARNNAITLYSSYSGDKLTVSGGFLFNRIVNQENGGMANDDDLLGTETKYVQMRLTDARSDFKSNYFFAGASYTLGIQKKTGDTLLFKPVADLIYSFVMSNNLRLFTEGTDENNKIFFPVSYLNRDFTNDSARFNSTENVVQLKFNESPDKKFSFGKRVFAGVELVTRSFASPAYKDAVYPFFPGTYNGTLYVGPEPWWNIQKYTNSFVGGGFFRKTGKFLRWDFDGRQYVTGHLAGQTELNGSVTKPLTLFNDSLAFLEIGGNLWNRVPDYFQESYFSNRFRWTQDLNFEQRMNASARLVSPGFHLDSGAGYALINNFLYHDTLGIPSQTKKELLVLAAFVNKEFHLGPFILQTHLLWQKASLPEFIRLPDLSARLVVSYHTVLAKVLFVQLGADTRYNTAYFADAYQPATGFFYLQNEKQIGNYPYMDLFANLKLKRTRVFFQYMNIGSLFLNQPYFTAYHYPMNRATFRLGVAWSFYN